VFISAASLPKLHPSRFEDAIGRVGAISALHRIGYDEPKGHYIHHRYTKMFVWREFARAQMERDAWLCLQA
ncbi:unnamed protein product, partial [Acidithrix sp. C25]